MTEKEYEEERKKRLLEDKIKGIELKILQEKIVNMPREVFFEIVTGKTINAEKLNKLSNTEFMKFIKETLKKKHDYLQSTKKARQEKTINEALKINRAVKKIKL